MGNAYETVCTGVLVAAVFTATAMSSDVSASEEVPEIANPQLPTIATLMISKDGRQVIVYNPIKCKEVGAAVCGFYRAHERGHVVLKAHLCTVQVLCGRRG